MRPWTGYNCTMKNDDLERKGLRTLARIENELEEIKDRTANPKRTFVNGIIYGAGAFVGGVIAIILLGWALSIAGFIPGAAEIAHVIQETVQSARR